MRSINVVCLILLLLLSSIRVGSLNEGEVYEFKIEKETNLLRELDEYKLKYEKYTHIEFSLRVTINEYNTQNKVVTYTVGNPTLNSYTEYTSNLDLSNNSYNQFLIPTLLTMTSKNSISYIADIIFYESLDLPINTYPFVIFGTEGINHALLNFQASEVEIPEIYYPGASNEFNHYTVHSLLNSSSSYIFMGESSIDQGLKNIANETKSWDFEIDLKNFKVYDEILDEFLEYNLYSSGIKLSYTDDLILSDLESNINYIANGSSYIETKSTMYKVALIEDEAIKFNIQDLLQMPALSGLLILILLILIVKCGKDKKLNNKRG